MGEVLNFRSNAFLIISFILFVALFFLGSTADELINKNQFFDPRILVMFLLAEPHFALTIPLMYGYRSVFIEHRFIFSYVPIMIVVFGALLFFFANQFFLLIFLIANIYHVNRQSVGMSILQGTNLFSIKTLYENSLHFFAGILIFSVFIIPEYKMILAAILLVVTMILNVTYYYKNLNKFPDIKSMYILLQGFLIFLPVAFFDDIILAFAVGISIHYMQYISIGSNVLSNGFGYKIMIVMLFCVLYSLLSSSSLVGFITNDKNSFIIFIPTILQLLHFYFDAFLWRKKGSVEIVKNTLEKSF